MNEQSRINLELDDDGYPTDASLAVITACRHEDFPALMKAIKPCWQYGTVGFWQEPGEEGGCKVYEISTAGWSGNESIVVALKANVMFWALCWVQSRRGGHYIFHVPKPKAAP